MTRSGCITCITCITCLVLLPKCTNSIAKKSRFLKQKHNKKTAWGNIDPKIFIY